MNKRRQGDREKSGTTVAPKEKITRLRRTVWRYYHRYGRHDLPWRKTTNPYHILVSEVMLQQTQVARVIQKYHPFLQQFPTVRSLATSSRRDVLAAWQGLGYNRRAKMLHEAAKAVMMRHRGCVPRTYHELVALPGVGPYTAQAICVFAYNQPGGMVETNIRTVLFHHLFTTHTQVPDTVLLAVAETLCSDTKPREWYWALMDYGSHLKEQGVQVNSKSKHYTKQSRFEGSDRQIRGALVRALTAATRACTEAELIQQTKTAPARTRTQLKRLHQEGLVRKVRGGWSV
jgi:A/G-specific adenine glycosylase